MKTKSIFSTLFVGVLLCACSNEETPNNVASQLVKGINVTIDDANYDLTPTTRSTYVVDEERGFVSSWTEGDTIGIYPIGGDQVAFPISEGDGSKSAKFDGGAWALRSAYQYAAYYPFSRKNYNISEKEIPVSYTGQTQTANNSTSHLATYDYLAAAATQPDENGNVNLAMKHFGCFVRFQIPIKVSGTFTELRLSTSESSLITEGTVNLQAETPSITAKKTMASLGLKLDNIAIENGETLVAYAMLAPVDLSGQALTITLTTAAGGYYYYKTTGKNMVAGSAYNYPITNVPEANGHDYVDLGLPSGTLWATMNIGANTPEEIGHYYLWGDVVPLDEYHWIYNSPYLNYKFYTYTYWHYDYQRTSIIKYSPEDEKTILDDEDDVAHVEWGGSWRLPTITEQQELIQNCTVESSTINSIPVSKVTGPNGNYIILPRAGYVDSSSDRDSQWDSENKRYLYRFYKQNLSSTASGYYLSKQLDPAYTDETGWSSDGWSRYGYTASRCLQVWDSGLGKDTWERMSYGLNARAVL